MGSVTVQLDDELLALVQERAAASGRSQEEVVADAVRRGLAARSLREILDSGRTGVEISEEDAMQLALEEQRASRRERAARDSA